MRRGCHRDHMAGDVGVAFLSLILTDAQGEARSTYAEVAGVGR